MPFSATLPRQALAASWAAVCSRALDQDQMEVDFINLHVLFTVQYGLDSTDSCMWQLEHPRKPGTSIAILLNRLLDQKAPERFPKPGGWLRSSWLRAADELMVAAEELTSVAREHSLLRAKMSKY